VATAGTTPWQRASSRTLKTELVDHEVYATRASAVTSIAEHIDVFYNLQRRPSSIGYVSPTEFELKLHSQNKEA
jgi:transposase InsO family protein